VADLRASKTTTSLPLRSGSRLGALSLSAARFCFDGGRLAATISAVSAVLAARNGGSKRRGRSPLWLKVKNPNAPAVKREAEEDWGGIEPMKSLVVAMVLSFVTSVAFAQLPYAGMEARSIKALSEQQIADLKAGRGMGLH